MRGQWCCNTRSHDFVNSQPSGARHHKTHRDYTRGNTRTSIRSIQPFPIRLTPDLRQALEQAAQAAGRSLQAEIARRLESTLATTG